MGMTIAEKILASHAGLKEVKAGQYVTAKVDKLMAGHGGYGDTLAKGFRETGITKVWDPDRVIFIMDHDVPAMDLKVAEECATARRFVKEFGITEFYEVGKGGICHQLMPEKGHALPGTLVAGMDSHTTSYGAFNCAATAIQYPEACYLAAKGEIWFRVPETIRYEITGKLPPMIFGKDVILKIAGDNGTDFAIYKSIEFVGPAVEQLTLADRWTMANMGVEVGAKFALFEADHKTLAFLKGRTKEKFTPVTSDADALFEQTIKLDISRLEPQVAFPHEISNVRPASEAGQVYINQAFLGSCTGGRMEDLEAAAKVMGKRKVQAGVRMIVIPASAEIFDKALSSGLLQQFADAGAFIAGPSCGPCGGGSMGVLAAGERCISTSNRNFKGRMGSTESEVYLSSAATVAASAVTGYITDPRGI